LFLYQKHFFPFFVIVVRWSLWGGELAATSTFTNSTNEGINQKETPGRLGKSIFWRLGGIKSMRL
jgi:hypothetical protein